MWEIWLTVRPKRRQLLFQVGLREIHYRRYSFMARMEAPFQSEFFPVEV